MRNRRWLRYGLGSLVVASAALGSFLVACGDDEEGTTVTPDGGGTDTGTPDTGTPADTGTPDAPAQPDLAKLTIANAATDLGAGANFTGTNITAVRVCFAIDDVVTPIPPQPNRASSALPAGIPIGFGGQFPSFGLDLETRKVTPYVMNAQAMKAKGVESTAGSVGPTCDEILKAGAVLDGGATFTENVDYWKLADIPSGTFKKGKSYALVLTGCTADAEQANVALGQCGPGIAFDDAGVGNLKVGVFELDREQALSATEFGAQFIHASAATSAAGVTVRPEIVAPADAGTRGAIGTEGDAGVAYGSATTMTKLTGVNVDTDLLKVSTIPSVQMPLKGAGSIQLISYPPGADGGAQVPPGAEYRNGAGFVFIAVGDPTGTQTPTTMVGPTTTFNGRYIHFLGFPTDPTIVKFAP